MQTSKENRHPSFTGTDFMQGFTEKYNQFLFQLQIFVKIHHLKSQMFT